MRSPQILSLDHAYPNHNLAPYLSIHPSDSVLAYVGEFDGVLVGAFRLTSGQVCPTPLLLGVQAATVVLWAFRRPKHPGN